MDGKLFEGGREIRTVVKDTKSKWRAVESGVPQGSALAPILFLIYINDMPEGVNSYINLFADDMKLSSRVLQLLTFEKV